MLDDGCDVIVENENHNLLRVQVKSTVKDEKNGKYKVSTGRGSKVKTKINKDLDIIAVFLTAENIWYFIPAQMVDVYTIYIRPHLEDCRYNDYKDNWSAFDR